MPLVLISLLALAVGAGRVGIRSAPAEAAPGGIVTVTEVTLGLGGVVVPNAWAPLTVSLVSDRAMPAVLEVETRRRRAPATLRVRVPLHLQGASARKMAVPVLVTDPREPVIVRVLDGAQERARMRVNPAPGRLAEGVVVALSRRQAGLHRLLPPESRLQVAYLSEDELPARWQLYESARAVIVRDLDDRRLAAAQLDALTGWVAAGGKMLVAVSPGSGLPVPIRDLLRRPLAAGGTPGGAQSFGWGKGEIVVIPSDPFSPNLPDEAAALWRFYLTVQASRPLTGPALLEVLPPGAGASSRLQILALLAVAGYLLMLGPLARGLRSGRLGTVTVAAVFAGWTGMTLMVATGARAQMTGIVQGAVAEVAPDLGLARVETISRIALPGRRTFVVRGAGGMLSHPLGEADATLHLGEETLLSGRTTSRSVGIRSTTVIPLEIRGSYRQGEPEEVVITNRSGRPLSGALIARGGQVQPLPDIGPQARVVLRPLAWRDSPSLETARRTEARVLAWTLNHLEPDAVGASAPYLLAWVADDRGVLRQNGRAAPLLIVVPLTLQAGGGAP